MNRQRDSCQLLQNKECKNVESGFLTRRNSISIEVIGVLTGEISRVGSNKIGGISTLKQSRGLPAALEYSLLGARASTVEQQRALALSVSVEGCITAVMDAAA